MPPTAAGGILVNGEWKLDGTDQKYDSRPVTFCHQSKMWFTPWPVGRKHVVSLVPDPNLFSNVFTNSCRPHRLKYQFLTAESFLISPAKQKKQYYLKEID